LVLMKLATSMLLSPSFNGIFHKNANGFCIFQLYLEFVWRNSIFLVKSLLIYDSRSILKCSHGTFVTFILENGVPRGKLQLLGFFQYNFWHKMSTLNEISSCIGLKPHYVHTAWLHKISPNLIVCRICSINSIRNPRHGFADNRSKNNIYHNQASRGTNAGAGAKRD
jgi:hypothetical protein